MKERGETTNLKFKSVCVILGGRGEKRGKSKRPSEIRV